MKTAEELYQEFRKMGYTHQQARELSLKAEQLEQENNIYLTPIK